MSGIGSLGLDSTLRYLMQGTKDCHRYWWHLRELLYRQPRVAPTSFSAKICALLKKKQAVKKLIIIVRVYDSITVSSMWELTPVGTRYS